MKKLMPFLIFLMIFPACKSFQYTKKPRVTIENSDIEKITLKDLTMKFDILIHNPYPIGLTLDGININFMLEDKQLLKASTSKGLKIKANGKETASVEVNIRYEDIIKIVKDYTKKEYLDSVINIEVKIPLPNFPGLDKNYTFRYALNKKLPALKPSFDIANFKVELPPAAEILKAVGKKINLLDTAAYISGKKKFDLKALMKSDIPVKINFDLMIINNTEAGLLFNSLDYDLSVNSDSLVKGRSEKITNSGKTSKMTVSNVFSSKNIAGSFVKAHKAGKGKYIMKGESSLKLPDIIQKKPVRFVIDTEGNLNIK